MKKILVLWVLTMGAIAMGHGQSTPKPSDTATFENVKVFPNPATNVVNILGLKNSRKAAISIFDIYGNLALSRQWEIRRNAVNIPVNTLAPGAYIITIRSDEQQIRTKFYKK
ncbi:T9SS type A sorting domain-containing protein [Pseudozobellia thermophila]|uniref:Por secretion system C-terminal sorting domain-containing protein n=1 Tax=Pseudozobellia thermophila TaxID=192903 RepID=A0A1M6KH39_9FLAO|nr:T9SS type A sorting domain-containing protein [Pseudozobellia thermophila]SHJ58265.1 Por secretion system C-terminal sorting domain-containing protein [Pseudozobellia thermophila]